ncbi:MAG: METTL5 family protein [Methanoregulaceae archaeon]|nr:METTL5 family protein [Methanoregulaceae archaeon]
MKLKKLEILLSRLDESTHPIASWEQYQTPASLAARVLYQANMNGDIQGRSVCDLGCGNGIFAIGAALLGACRVTGVEIDPDVLPVAENNAKKMAVDVEFIPGDVSDQAFLARLGHFDTVITNPPFGAQKAHADRPFIDAGIFIGDTAYVLFNEGSLEFVRSYIAGRAKISEVILGKFPLKHTFSFHTKEVREIKIEIVHLVKQHEL